MIASRPWLASCATGLAVLSAAVGAAAAELEAEPHMLVRSLQRLQDQIADGDKPAVRMQFELTKLVDENFRRLSRARVSDPRTARALISYSMLGGNPQTLERYLPAIGEANRSLGEIGAAVLAYQKGATNNAAVRLSRIDPREIGGMFGASIALIRGLITEDDETARADFDAARLLAPGTLIEEASLRRLMSIHRRQDEPRAFLRVSSRYARRFVASPYALQFAQEFTAGVVAMGDRMNMDVVAEIIEFMPKPYREALTLRLMHNATLDGKSDIVASIASLAPERTAGHGADEGHDIGPESGIRESFYARVSQVTSENVREVAEELRQIDTDTLSEGERNLLRAVLAVADAVTEPVATVPETSPVMQNADARESILSDAPKQDNQIEPVLSDFDDFIGGARSKLESVDKLLEEIQ